MCVVLCVLCVCCVCCVCTMCDECGCDMCVVCVEFDTDLSTCSCGEAIDLCYHWHCQLPDTLHDRGAKIKAFFKIGLVSILSSITYEDTKQKVMNARSKVGLMCIHCAWLFVIDLPHFLDVVACAEDRSHCFEDGHTNARAQINLLEAFLKLLQHAQR